MKARLVVAVLVVSALVVLTSAVWAESPVRSNPHKTVSPPNGRSAKVIKEYTLPFPKGRVLRPRISGDWVFAIYNTDLSYQNATAQIVGYNLATKQTYTFWPGGAYQPDVNGDFATWTGKPSEQLTYPTYNGQPSKEMPSNLLVCDLVTGRYYCPPIKTYNAAFPVVRDHCVAYINGGHVFLVDMRNGVTRRISDSAKGNRNAGLTIGGDYIA